jgi:hypothetical protein
MLLCVGGLMAMVVTLTVAVAVPTSSGHRT